MKNKEILKPVIIANWKTNPATVKEAVLLAQKIEQGTAKFKNVETIITPPFPFLIPVLEVLKKSKLGAQTTFWTAGGPYTGEVSWLQLKNLGVSHVILGHSERKIHLGESDEAINKKTLAVLENNMTAILCFGERERMGNDIPIILEDQLKKALRGVRKDKIKNLIVAYEPIWAISTTPNSLPDTPDNAFRAVIFIGKILANLYGSRSAKLVRIIYGGSVMAKNIKGFLKEGKMRGALVGGASLVAEEFVKVVAEADSLVRKQVDGNRAF